MVKDPISRHRGSPDRKDARLHPAQAAAVENEQQLLSDILDHLTEAVAYFDSGKQLVRWNQAFETTLSRDFNWWDTKPYFSEVAKIISTKISADSPEDTRSWWIDAAAGDPVVEVPAELQLANGKSYVVKLSEVGANGKVLLLYDVTALARRGSALEQSNRDLEQFAYIASHDLQEPLRTVASFTQLLKRRYNHLLDEKGREYINYAVDGSRRMQVLLDELLYFARINDEPPDREPISLDKVCKESLENLCELISRSNGTIHVSDPLPMVTGNHAQLTQVFQNLIGNALKFNQSRPEIFISSVERQGLWVIQISDNGIGLEGKHMEKIFVIFQRLNNKSLSKGNGLGLAICKKVIENHGGRIWVDSQIGQGATFTFTLPVAVNSVVQKDAEPA